MIPDIQFQIIPFHIPMMGTSHSGSVQIQTGCIAECFFGSDSGGPTVVPKVQIVTSMLVRLLPAVFRCDRFSSPQTQNLGLICALKSLNSSPTLCFAASFDSELNFPNGGPSVGDSHHALKNGPPTHKSPAKTGRSCHNNNWSHHSPATVSPDKSLRSRCCKLMALAMTQPVEPRSTCSPNTKPAKPPRSSNTPDRSSVSTEMACMPCAGRHRQKPCSVT